MFQIKNFIFEVVSFFIARARARLYYIYRTVIANPPTVGEAISSFKSEIASSLNNAPRNDKRLDNSTGLIVLMAMAGFLIFNSTSPLLAKPKNQNNHVSDQAVLSTLQNGDKFQKIDALDDIRSKKAFVHISDLQSKRELEKNPEIRIKINKTIAQMDDPDVLSVLFDSMKNDSDEKVREGAVRSLSRFAQNNAVAVEIAQVFQSDSSERVKKACILVLGLNASDESFRVLEEASKDVSPELRKQTALSLHKNSNKQAKKILKKLSRDKNPKVKAAAEKNL